MLPILSPSLPRDGAPVVPEYLNDVPRFGELYQVDWCREHRALDGEHGSALIPQAAGWIEWTGGGYQVGAGSVNIASVQTVAKGDVIVELAVPASHRDEWFPVGNVIGTSANRVWEYDDGSTRSTTRCRMRLAFTAGEGFYVDQSFRFSAYMRMRAPGETGRGNAPTPDVSGVRNRICVDGVESAAHRRLLRSYCETTRQRFEAHHETGGRHSPLDTAVAVAQMFRSASVDEAQTLWQAGPINTLTWNPREPQRHNDQWSYHNLIDFELDNGWQCDGILVAPRYTIDQIPYKLTLPQYEPGRLELAPYPWSEGLDHVGLVFLGRRRRA